MMTKITMLSCQQIIPMNRIGISKRWEISQMGMSYISYDKNSCQIAKKADVGRGGDGG
jgi:hypothetical protein